MIVKIWLITTLLSYIIYTRRIYTPESIWEKLLLWSICINPITFFTAVFLKGAGDEDYVKTNAEKCDRTKGEIK